jgi:hypothetical protein
MPPDQKERGGPESDARNDGYHDDDNDARCTV